MDGSRPSAAPADDSAVTLRVARTMDDLQKVFMVRALVYVAEQDCPYGEEYDGNDLAGATHLLAERDGEPVATLRIRWFCDFAKIERVCVRDGHRSGRITRRLMDEAIEIIRRKGYRKLIGQIQKPLLPYWKRYGLIHREHRGTFVFSDRVYIEVEGRYALHPKALTTETEPLTLDRPEGAWDEPGPLDHSVERGAADMSGRRVKAAPVPESPAAARKGIKEETN
ncbi:N-acetyltransferase [Marinicauda salina]|uniref:N-acetyltransferase n=1 Tax=Marinicauda salina TaxID=2135793 RepID=A0A2U2BTS3_9PROT|nr:GNAT family N-acetyltransferase [Marinicauda salina]PWE17399.1 N-acetyltransferase [Marinicauda salina]